MSASIFVVGNGMGGVGKTTTAVQLALGLWLDGAKVWLVDGDQQQTATGAITARADTGRGMIAASAYSDGKTLVAQVYQQADAYDYVIIDAGGRDSKALRGAMGLADAILIPFQPRSFDVWALSDIAEIYDEVSATNTDLKAFAFVNRGDIGGTDNRDAAAAVAEYPQFKLLDVCVRNRKAFADACGMGLRVEEMPRRDQKACLEVDLLKSQFLSAVNGQ